MSPTSNTDDRKAGIKGRRIPGRPGRFDPSMPLHMTTRRRAMHGTTNESPSVNGSLDDDNSRRSSADDGRPTTSHSGFSQSHGNEAEEPEVADTIVTPGPQVEPTQSPFGSKAERSVSTPLPLMEQSPSPSRKRKRSPSTPPSDRGRLFITPSPEQHRDVHTSDEEDAVEVIDSANLSDRRVTESSSESGAQADEANAVTANSVDDTPLASVAMSPASSVSVSVDDLVSKQLDDTVDAVMQLEDTEVIEDVDGVDAGEEPEGRVATDGEGRAVKRTRGKRRRGPHPDATIETYMRRQLELKRAYRTLARESKKILTVIAQRTLDDIISNPASCEEAAEFHTVIGGLDAALEKRTALIKTQQKLHGRLLGQRQMEERHVVHARCQLRMGEAQDAIMEKMERAMLDIAHAAQLEASGMQFDTDNEDDIVPKPKGMSYRFKRGKALDPKYDSRSRPALDAEQALNDMSKRFAIRKMLQALNADEKPATAGAFTVMNGATRDAALARHQDTLNARILIDAAIEVERIASIPIIRNEEALGLQLLGDLASRPSITAVAQDAMHAKHARGSIVGQTPSQVFPPPMAPLLRESHPIEFTASPRAQQIFRERYDASMPPPRTPRDENAAFAQSSNFRRMEERVPVPAKQTARINGLTSIAAKRPESDQLRRPGRAPALSREHSTESAQRYSSEPKRRDDQTPETRPWIAPALVSTAPPDRQATGTASRQSFAFPRDILLSSDPDDTTESRDAGDGNSVRDVNVHHETMSTPNAVRGTQPYERPTNPGAIDQREQRDGMAVTTRHDLHTEAPGSPRSRKSSVTLKQEAPSEGSHGGDAPRPREQRTNNKPKHNKTSKEDRGGASRRLHKNKNKQKRQESFGTQSLNGAPQADATLLKTEAQPYDQSIRSWQPDSTQQAPFALQPMLPQQIPPFVFPLQQEPPQHYFPHEHMRREYTHGEPNHHHRNSFPPPLQPAWQPNTTYATQALPAHQLPPTHQPLPAHQPPLAHQPPPVHQPHPAHQSLPPGVAPDGYRSHPLRDPPPALPLFLRPPQGPLSAQLQPPPGLYGQQYGGPAIAPATPDPRYLPPGCAPAQTRLPAFAQQQKHDEGQRRRTQSDVHQNRRQWNEYQPKNRR